jgi:hypothetical protein
MRNFLACQGYDQSVAILYQDNMSCLALVKRGQPGADGSRHINIRRFWLKEREDCSEVQTIHLGTKLMFANCLTKPVQGE